MAQITAALVKQLREMTDAGMMECKKALTETDGDLDAAVDVLRTRGLAAAAKKAGRETNEGLIATFVSEDGKIASMIEVNCETDFVARNEKFVSFANMLAKAVADNDPKDLDAFKAVTVDGETIEEKLTEAIHTIGENMNIARFTRIVSENGFVDSYIHMGGKIGVLVELSAVSGDLKACAHDVALQIAAAAPIALDQDSVDPAVIDHEMEIYKAQAAESGKPEAIQEKIATGRLQKFFKERCLVEQAFVKDPDKTIKAYVTECGKAAGVEASVKNFKRFELGETA